MENEDVERAAARNYALRGLRTVAIGALLAITPLMQLVGGAFDHLWLVLGLFGLAAVAMVSAERHYNERYGYVARSTWHDPREAAVGAVAVGALVGGLHLTGLPVNLLAIGVAGLWLVFAMAGAGRQRHQAIIFGAVLVAGALPLWTGAETEAWGLLLGAVAMAISGLLDHRLFVRTYGPADPRPGLRQRSRRSVRNVTE